MKQTMPLGKTAETQVHALSYINLYLYDHVTHLGVKKKHTLTLVLHLVMAAQRVFRVAAAAAGLAQAAQ